MAQRPTQLLKTRPSEPDLIVDPENSTQPFGDEIAVWQSEMARYIKEDLQHEDHLIGINYAGAKFPAPPIGCTEEANDEGDCSFSSPYIDVLSFNYPIGNTGREDPDRYFETSIELRKIRSNLSLLNKLKPILMTESAGVFDAKCDVTDSEWIRDLFVSSFTGLAGAGMPWGFQYGDRPDLSYWQEWLAGFFEDVDLNTGVWFSERNQAVDGGEVLWLYNVATGERVGIMQNRRYNFYYESVGSVYIHENGMATGDTSKCYEFPLPDSWLEGVNLWNILTPVEISSSQFLTGLTDIKVYNPLGAGSDQPIYEGPAISSANPTGVNFLLNGSNPYLLFKAYPSLGRLSSQDENAEAENPMRQNELSGTEVSLWPNPTTAVVNIQVGPVVSTGKYHLMTIDGRIVEHSSLKTNGVTELDLSSIEAGSYIVMVELSNKKRIWKRLEVL